MYRNKRIEKIWYFKPAADDGLRVPIKVVQHDVLDVQVRGLTENVVFSKFAVEHFPQKIDSLHTTDDLNETLLPLTDEVDKNVAIVLRGTILRFMGDKPEPRHTFLDTAALEETTAEERGKEYSANMWMSTADKLRFIVGLGINRAYLRDEIFLQLCKQVSKNPSTQSAVKGWILLSLCLGCFTPSDEVENVVVSVLRCGPEDYACYCDQKMARTKKNGTRKQPPSKLELQAAQRMLFPMVPVELNDGREIMLNVDSSTTTKEMCADVADEMGQEHIPGYGIQITIFDKTINLGSGSEKLMDAIWLCEQSARELGKHDDFTAWKIYHRKYVFTPLDEFLVDVNWTDFAFSFVVDGLRTGVSRIRRASNIQKRNSARKGSVPPVPPPQRRGSRVERKSSLHLVDQKPQSLDRLPSFTSSISSSNDFGAPSLNDSESDSNNVVYCQENNNSSENAKKEINKICSDGSVEIYNLKSYAQKNFSSSEHIKNWKQHGALSSLWSHQSEPIKKPILLRLGDNESLANIAINMFSGVLLYMEKCWSPSTSKHYKMEIIRNIFTTTVNQDLLKDELYCQILKQLTNNPDKNSMQQGWNLLYLCTSLFTCSDDLLKEVLLFLASWSNHVPAAVKCLTSLRRTVQTGSRLYPPHFVEFAAATKWCETVLHKVTFPDMSSMNFPIDSHTKVKDLINCIGKRLNLLSTQGISLFIKMFSKIMVLNPDDFLFDGIQQCTEQIEKVLLQQSVVFNKAKGIPYKLFFLRRLWDSFSPGHDPKADAIIHYPQEFLKYMRGYYQLTVEEMSYLAALVLKIKFGDDENCCPEITNILHELLPHHMIDALFPELWRHYILVNYKKTTTKTQTEIRKEYLSMLQKQERFGSAYFKVKQTNFPDASKVVILGISCKAISLIDPISKDTIRKYFIKDIVSHFTDFHTYTLQVQINIDKIETYTFRTTQEFEISNMVASYISGT